MAATMQGSWRAAPHAVVDFAINNKTKSAFSNSEWNTIVRAGLQAACDYWIDNYLQLRFQAYARAVGIYTGAKRKGLPLVKTGNLRANVLQTARATVTATASKAEGVIRIPMPNIQGATPTKGHKYMNYASNPVVVETLSKITPEELERMSMVCAAVMTEMIESATITMTRGKVVKSMIANGGTEDHKGFASQIHRERVGGGQIKARLSDHHRMTAKESAARAKVGQVRPRLTLKDFHTSRKGVA